MGQIKDGLNWREKLFCQYYIECNGIGAQAAIKAGYAGRNHACKILKRPRIQKEINRLSRERSEAIGMSKDWLMVKLKSIIDKIDKIDESDLTFKDTVAAIQEVIKLNGLYVPTPTLFVEEDDQREEINKIVSRIDGNSDNSNELDDDLIDPKEVFLDENGDEVTGIGSFPKAEDDENQC